MQNQKKGRQVDLFADEDAASMELRDDGDGDSIVEESYESETSEPTTPRSPKANSPKKKRTAKRTKPRAKLYHLTTSTPRSTKPPSKASTLQSVHRMKLRSRKTTSDT